MKNISYFKLQAKNLFHDYKLDFMTDDQFYNCTSRFFNINQVISDYGVDIEGNFTLMKAQHIIAKIVGFNSWDDLTKASEDLLEQKKSIFDSLGLKIKKQKIYKIDLSGCRQIDQGKAGDYLLKCPKLPELEEIIKLTPDSYFLSCNTHNIDNLSSDDKHYYVNVVPKNSTIRILVPGARWPDWYAVGVKNVE